MPFNALELNRTFAHYNSWMNQKLLDSCSVLRDDARKRSLSIPFGSLHGVWNHLLVADNMWLSRFEGTPLPFEFQGLSMEIFTDWNELKVARIALDQRIGDFARGLSEERLGSLLRWQPATLPEAQQTPLWILLSHFWNHQTHHRGQITCAMELLGIDCGVTDLLRLPDLPLS